MQDYTAPAPQKNWLKIIGWRILFPPILIWDFFQFIFNALGGKLFGKIILPAQRIYRCDLLSFYPIAIKQRINGLDTLYAQQEDTQTSGYVINFAAPGTRYQEQLYLMLSGCAPTETSVCFNYKDCSGTEAQVMESAITDGVAQVQYLIGLGIAAEKIHLKGIGPKGQAIADAVANLAPGQKRTLLHDIRPQEGKEEAKKVGFSICSTDYPDNLIVQFASDPNSAHDEAVRKAIQLGFSPYSFVERHLVIRNGEEGIARKLIKEYKKNKDAKEDKSQPPTPWPLCAIHLINTPEDQHQTAIQVAKTLYNTEIPPLALNVYNPLTVHTHDGCSLSTLEIQHPSQLHLEKESEKSYVIHFNGNGSNPFDERMLNYLSHEANTLQCNIVAFNYRGVGKSTGNASSIDDLVTDGIAQVERLLARGANAEKIVLDGMSLGGGVATLVAKYFHDRGKPVKLFNEQSFSNITNVVVGWIRQRSFTGWINHIFREFRYVPPDEEHLFGIILGYILKPLIKLVLCIVNWEIEAADAFKEIPDTHKEYLLLRTPKKYRNYPSIDDPVMTPYSTLHSALRTGRQITKMKMKISHAFGGETEEELERFKAHNRARKIYPKEEREVNMHGCVKGALTNYEGMSGLEFFKRFYESGIGKPEAKASETYLEESTSESESNLSARSGLDDFAL